MLYPPETSRLTHYWRVYKRFLQAAFAESSTYRLNFSLIILVDIVFYFGALASGEILFGNVESIGDWNREQFLFFIAFTLAVDHLHMTFFAESFWRFSEHVRTGGLDFILLRPVGAFFSTFFQHIRIPSILVGIIPWYFLWHYGYELQLVAWQCLLLIPLLLCALALQLCLEFLLTMLTFWLIESTGLNDIRLQLQQLSRWPDFIYLRPLRILFTYLCPILMISSVPVHTLFEPTVYLPLLGGMLMFIAGIACLTRYFWRKGLRQYESASS